MKWDNDNWEIYLNNLSGSNPINISNKNVDSDPAWSPDGRYIAFSRFTQYSSQDIYLYDTEKDGLLNISSDSVNEATPRWLPDGSKIVYSYHKMGDPFRTYIMNRDGSDKQKLLDFDANIYFLNDNFTFIYQSISTNTDRDYLVYLSNINRTSDEIIFDIRTIGKNYTGICDFNPVNNDILLTIAAQPQTPDILATYNLKSKKIDILSIAEPNWLYYRPKYSNDSKKIAFIERNYDEDISKLILFENGIKTELVQLTAENEWIDYNPLAWSPQDKYLAYGKNINQYGSMVWWKSYLYLVDINTKQNNFIDMGTDPVWNPKYSE
jgi:Tol biopolymer transport system component